MSKKKRIADLERRVRELEERPYWPPTTIVVLPAPQPSLPAPQFVPTWPNPWANPWVPPAGPIWIVDHTALPFVVSTDILPGTTVY